jgi:hypothetical protein
MWFLSPMFWRLGGCRLRQAFPGPKMKSRCSITCATIPGGRIGTRVLGSSSPANQMFKS